MRHPICRHPSVVLGGSTALGVRSLIPALALFPLLRLPAPAFLSVEWAWDRTVPELLSRADNGILYEFQGGDWPQMQLLHADGAFSGELHFLWPGSPVSFIQPPPVSQRKGGGEGCNGNYHSSVHQDSQRRLAQGVPWVLRNLISAAFSLGSLWSLGSR